MGVSSLKFRMIVFAGFIIFFVIVVAVTASVGVNRLDTRLPALQTQEIATKIETIKIGREVNYVSRLTRNIAGELRQAVARFTL